jgi:uncharacterized protein YegL
MTKSKEIDTLEIKNWQIFLNTLVGNKNDEIEVLGTKANKVQFKSSEKIIESLQKILASSSLLKEQIIHAIAVKKKIDNTQENKEEKIEDNTPSHILELFNKSGADILNFLVSNKILNHLDLKSFSAKETKYGTTIFEIDDKEGMLEIDLAKFKYLQKLLSNKEEIINKLEEKELSEEQKITFSKNRVSEDNNVLIINSKDGKAEIIFNKNTLLQEIQNVYKGNAPILSEVETDIVFEIDGEYLKFKVGEELSRIIFKPEDEGLRPIIFPKEEIDSKILKAQLEQPHLLHLVVDTSLSMQYDMRQCKKELVKIVDKYTKEVPSWKIVLTEFNTYTSTKVFYSKEKDVITNIKNTINNFTADNYTKLFDTMDKCLQDINDNLDKYSNPSIVLITDGENNEGTKDCDGVINTTKIIREKSSSFSMFTLGLREYDQGFTKDVQDMGGIHINLNKIDEIELFNEHINRLNVSKEMVSFIQDSITKYMQAPKGKITVPDILLKEGDEISHQGEKYKIGTEKTQSIEAEIQSDNSVDVNLESENKKLDNKEENKEAIEDLLNIDSSVLSDHSINLGGEGEDLE